MPEAIMKCRHTFAYFYIIILDQPIIESFFKTGKE